MKTKEEGNGDGDGDGETLEGHCQAQFGMLKRHDRFWYTIYAHATYDL